MPERLDEIDMGQVQKLKEGYNKIISEVGKVFVGQKEVLDLLLVAILSRGHTLLEGVPGLGKTLLVRTLSKVLDLKFRRIQFTPDLMPTDITGTEIIEEDFDTGRRTFKFIHGPIFANLVLADEINRTPPKTQAALLEAMQELSVTAGNETMNLEPPFFVLATQNPIEQEGTYPLPEAQLDRFMFNVMITYPTASEEEDIVLSTTADYKAEFDRILTREDILELQNIVRRVPVSKHVVRYAVDLVRATRPMEEGVPKFIRDFLTWGAGPRASQYLILGGKARALLNNRFNVATEDIAALAQPVLRHRIVTSFAAEAENISTDKIIERLVKEVKVPSYK